MLSAPAKSHKTSLTPLQLALVRRHRWLRLLEEGKAKSLRELSEKEKGDNSYVSRMVNLTLLAPDIVAAILDDQLPEGISLFDLAVDVPAGWQEQRRRLQGSPARSKRHIQFVTKQSRNHPEDLITRLVTTYYPRISRQTELLLWVRRRPDAPK